MDALEEHHATAAIARRELFAALVEPNRGDDVGCERRRMEKSAPIGSTERNARRDGMLIRFLPGRRGGTAFGRTRARTILHLFAGRSLAEHLAEFHSSSSRGSLAAAIAYARSGPRRPSQHKNPVPGLATRRGPPTRRGAVTRRFDAGRRARASKTAACGRRARGRPAGGFASRCDRARGRPTRVARLRRRDNAEIALAEKTTPGETTLNRLTRPAGERWARRDCRRGVDRQFDGYLWSLDICDRISIGLGTRQSEFRTRQLSCNTRTFSRCMTNRPRVSSAFYVLMSRVF